MAEQDPIQEEGGEEELYEHYNITVDKGQKTVRIDKYLMERIEKSSRSRIQNACNYGFIRVNGRGVKPNYKVRPLDVIQVMLEQEPRGVAEVKPEDIPLDIIYEDDHLMIVNKPAGMVVHPGVGNWTGTLVNGLVHYMDSKNLPVMKGNQPDRPGLVHRIDKDTSGLLVVSKTEEAMAGLSKQFYDHTIDREYIALVWGDVEPHKGTIKGAIGRHPVMKLQMFVWEDEPHRGKDATTHYEVLESLYYVTLVKCKLETGRTHQIRVHMKYIGHTLFNDARYGGEKILKGAVFSKYRQFVENCFEIMPRQALHAATLGFEHPVTKERMHFECPLPEDFTNVLEKWRGYTASRKEKLN